MTQSSRSSRKFLLSFRTHLIIVESLSEAVFVYLAAPAEQLAALAEQLAALAEQLAALAKQLAAFY